MIRAIALAAAVGLATIASAAADPARAPGAPPPAATMRPVGPDAPQLPARLDDGGVVRLPPMVIRQDRPATDHRPAYIGFGLIILAAVFWWNRRRRDRFDREDGAPPPRERRRRRDASEARTDREAEADADDLLAAARGDLPAPADSLEPDPRASAPPDPPTRKSTP